MDIVFELLLKAQQQISANGVGLQGDRLMFSPIGQHVHVEFFGNAFGNGFDEFLRVISEQEIAMKLKSLIIRGIDEGANGTKNYDLTVLLDSEVTFPVLEIIFIEPTLPEHHNQTVIGSEYEEEGQIGRFVAKTPVLRELTVPSAPDASFFATSLPSLTYLRIDSGYDTQNFILNLSESRSLPNLRTLDFGDYNQRYMENYPNGDEYTNGCTSFEHFRILFVSKAFSPVTRFVLRNSILSKDQLEELHAIKRELQFLVIQSPQGEYVR